MRVPVTFVHFALTKRNRKSRFDLSDLVHFQFHGGHAQNPLCLLDFFSRLSICEKGRLPWRPRADSPCPNTVARLFSSDFDSGDR